MSLGERDQLGGREENQTQNLGTWKELKVMFQIPSVAIGTRYHVTSCSTKTFNSAIKEVVLVQ